MSQELAWLEPQSPEEIMKDLLYRHEVDRAYVLFSGGKDSACVDHFVAANYPGIYAGRLFTNTTMAAPEVRRFVIEDSRRLGRPLTMLWPPSTYYDFVIRNGFPGNSVHKVVMAKLKYRSWEYFSRQCRRGPKTAFISGVRKKESWARSKVHVYSKSPIDVDKGITFCKPFLYKNGEQLYGYFMENGLRKSPMYEWLDLSGECLCGSFAEPWEIKAIEKGVPFVFETIRWMEAQVAARIAELEGAMRTPDEDGVLRRLKASPRWGSGQGAEATEEQHVLEDYCGESCQAG